MKMGNKVNKERPLEQIRPKTERKTSKNRQGKKIMGL